MGTVLARSLVKGRGTTRLLRQNARAPIHRMLSLNSLFLSSLPHTLSSSLRLLISFHLSQHAPKPMVAQVASSQNSSVYGYLFLSTLRRATTGVHSMIDGLVPGASSNTCFWLGYGSN